VIDKIDILTADQIWQTALGELQLQLTGATFNAWLGRAAFQKYEDGVFTIGVHNEHARDWLENRLSNMIERTLAGITGQSAKVKFIVTPLAARSGEGDSAPAPQQSENTSAVAAAPELPDLKEVGYFPVSRYECTFWAPLLGRVAWRVWEIVRGADIRKEKDDWTPERRWSAPEMARIVPCGPQAIVGVNRDVGRQAGALERLAALDVGKYHRQGDAHDPHTMYIVSVRVRLPILTPVQVMELTDTLRHRHDKWLEEHGFDPRDWFLKET
jgi:hypothetical protein